MTYIVDFHYMVDVDWDDSHYQFKPICEVEDLRSLVCWGFYGRHPDLTLLAII